MFDVRGNELSSNGVCLQGSLYYGSDYTVGPYTNLLHLGSHNLGKLRCAGLQGFEGLVFRVYSAMAAQGTCFGRLLFQSHKTIQISSKELPKKKVLGLPGGERTKG